MPGKYLDNVLSLIGRTPLIRLKAIESKGGAKIFGKYELANPGGSVKDRIALAMVEDAEQRGLLKARGTVIEPTSGNTGVGLAVVCAVKGYRCVLVMPDSVQSRRLGLFKAYGAEVIQTPFEKSMSGAIEKAEEMAAENPGWFMPMQFANKANPAAHRKTTAKEILKALDSKIDAFIAAVGTGGSLSGVAEVLKKKNPAVKVYAVEPQRSPVLSGGEAGPHGIPGIGAGFIPPVLKRELADGIIQISDQAAREMAARLAKEAGILAGISAGANVAAAVQVAAKMKPQQHVVTILCDQGEMYLDQDGHFA